jgi:hypothetical protein
LGTWDTLSSSFRSELTKETRRGEWKEVQRSRAELAALASPAAVLELLDRRASGPASEEMFEQRSRVLLVLIEEHRGEHRALVQAILLLAFMPMMRTLHRRFHRASADDELANTILEALLEAIAHYPLQRRRSKVAANLVRDAEARLCRRFTEDQQRRLAEREVAEELAVRSDSDTSVLVVAGELGRGRDHLETDMEDALDALIEMRVISDLERLLLSTTAVHRLQLKAWVATCPPELNGMRYEAAKKRTQRAAAKVREHLRSPARRPPDPGDSPR